MIKRKLFLFLLFLLGMVQGALAQKEAYAVLSNNGKTVTFYYDDQKSKRSGVVGINNTNQLHSQYSTATNAIIDKSFKDYRPSSTAYWFYNCEDLTSISGMENLNTENVTNMGGMFRNCHSLMNLNLSNFNTANVTNMHTMFYCCEALTSLDLSNFNTANVTNMNSMFCFCKVLKSLDLSNFNTSNVTDMGGMFLDCYGLTSLNVSNFNTANVTNMNYMFENCNWLKTIYANSNWDTTNLNSSYAMFRNCTRLVGGKGTKYDGNHVNIYYAHPDGGTSNPGYFTYKSDTPEDIEESIPSDGGNGQASGAYTVLNNGTLTFFYDNDRSSKTGTVYDIYTSYTGYPDWAKDSLGITKAVFDVSFANFKPTCTAYWFSCCPMMTEIEGLSRLDTRNVTDMRYMFHNCRSLIKLDTGDFLTSQVTDMSNMFSGCHNLNHVDVTCFNTANVTTMEAMFMDCRSLTEIDVTGFETKNVSTMANMFRGCSSLSEINLKNMSIASLTNTYAMFYGCEALTTIYSNTDWSAGSITSSDFMFGQCIELKGGNGTLFDASKTDKSYALPDGSNSSPGYFTMRNGGGKPGGNVGSNGAPVYAVLNNGTLTFYCDNLWNSRSGTRYDIDDLNYSYSDQLRSYRNMPEWIEDRNYIQRAVFDPSFANYKPKSTICWFYSCQYLTAIEGMEYLNTSEVTNMSAMFRFCYALTDVDVSHMDTRNVTDMSFVFCYCENLKHIDVSKFNTEKVTNMEHMFHTCPVETLDLRSFETSKVTDMNTMFDRCGSLKTIYAKKDKWNTDNVIFSSWMFTGCESLVGGQGTKFDSNHTDKEYAVIDEGMCAPGYLTGDAADLPREAYAVYKDSTLTFYYDCNINCRKAIESAVVFTEKQFAKKRNNADRPDWISSYSRLISTAVFDPSFADYDGVETVKYWFYNCNSLTVINGIENLNTSNVTDMRYMFYGCNSLTSLDLSSFNTSNVTTMRQMFEACRNLTSLDLSSFDTSKVTDMQGMFDVCNSLTSLNLSSFNTSNVTNMNFMFCGCRSLTDLDLKSFNTSKVTDMSVMFYSCFSLKSLDLSSFDTSNVTDMKSMFNACSSLSNLNISSFNTSNVTDMSSMFSGCRSLTGLDLNSFDASNVISMSYMFDGCRSLTSLDLSSFDTSKVTDMQGMFDVCNSLKNLDVSGFKTDNVTNMSSMFHDCSGLKNLDVSGFKTDKVTSMYDMFSGCSGLTSLDVSGFKNDNVTEMGGMFSGCSGLTSLDVSSFKTDNVTSMGGMFSGCSSLTSLDVSGFKTDNVTNMGSMFHDCSGLTSLDLSGFKTSNVTDMGGMFHGCSGLTNLDVSNFDTSNVTDMSYMFTDCSVLTTIYCGNDWNTDKVTSSSSMFYNCTNLVGGAGTVYSSSYIDKTYAHVDSGLDNPGYLTLRDSSQGGNAPEPSNIEVTDISQIDNAIYVDVMEEFRGTQTTISLKMKNTLPIRGFQFDLYLPTGVRVVKSTKGKIQGFLSEGRLPDEDEHTLTFSEQADGAIRFLCNSQYEETFTGNDGEIATLLINIADDMEEGDYPILLKAMKLTENNISNYYETALVQSKLTVSSYVVGDISGDGVVDVSDYTGVANHIHGNTSEGFNAKAADVDENNVIDVSDYTGIANIIHTGSIYGNNSNSRMMVNGSRKVKNDLGDKDNVIYISPFAALAGGQAAISIKMKNTAEIRSFQFDLQLPEGVTAVKSSKGKIQGMLNEGRLPDEDEHTLSFSEHEGNVIRFLCGSEYDETFTGNNGEIITLLVDVAADVEANDHPVYLRNMKLSESNISKYYKTEELESTLAVAPEGSVKGDANGDKSISVTDIAVVVNEILRIANTGGFLMYGADANGDGDITVTDIGVIVDKILGTNSSTGSRKMEPEVEPQ